MKKQILNQLLRDQEEKKPVVLATDLVTGNQGLIYYTSATGPLGQNPLIIEMGRSALQDDKTGIVKTELGEIFFHVYNPPLRMLLVGAVHIAQPLSRICRVAGYDVAIIDPRESFASPERFPEMTLVHEWPDDGLNKLDIDRRTAIVTLTHDPKLDDPALSVAIRSEAFYIGALGSKRTHSSRLERLKNEGFNDLEITRIKGPVGLNIGAVSPAEIAVSILAEVTQHLHAKEAKAAA